VSLSLECCIRSRYDEAVRLRHSDKDQIDHLNSSIGDANAEIGLLRQRFKSLGDELSRLNKDNGRLWDELQKARGVSAPAPVASPPFPAAPRFRTWTRRR